MCLNLELEGFFAFLIPQLSVAQQGRGLQLKPSSLCLREAPNCTLRIAHPGFAVAEGNSVAYCNKPL